MKKAIRRAVISVVGFSLISFMSCTPSGGQNDEPSTIGSTYDAWEAAFSVDLNITDAVSRNSDSATFIKETRSGNLSGSITINGTFDKLYHYYSPSSCYYVYTYDLSFEFDDYLDTCVYVSGVPQSPALTGTATLTGTLRADYPNYYTVSWSGAGWRLQGSITLSGALEGDVLIDLYYESDKDWYGSVKAGGTDWYVESY